MFNRKKVDRMFTRDLVFGLNLQFTSRPWMEQRKGKEINDLWLSRQLRPFGIKSSTLWLNDQSAKGYCLDDFHDVFRRYVAKSDLLALRAEYSQRPGGEPKAGALPQT